MPRHDDAPSPGRVLVDVVVAAVPRLPAFAFKPRGDLAPVGFEDGSRPAALSTHTQIYAYLRRSSRTLSLSSLSQMSSSWRGAANRVMLSPDVGK